MRDSSKSIASWTIILLILLQFVPLNRINPPPIQEIQFPESIKSSLKKACYDCHSYETQWRGVAYIAPASWIVSSTVSSGRTALNFSTSGDAQEITSGLMKIRIRNVVSKGVAHQQLYYLLTPERELTMTETRLLLQWLQ
ncbi:MAG: heme-binding domain-containing protein [Chlorobium sp.]